MSSGEIGEIIRNQQAQPSGPFGNMDASAFSAAAQAPGAGRFLSGPLSMGDIMGGSAVPQQPTQPDLPPAHTLPIDDLFDPSRGGGLLDYIQEARTPTANNFRFGGLIR